MVSMYNNDITKSLLVAIATYIPYNAYCLQWKTFVVATSC